MSEHARYHGWYTPAEYKQGERNYHFLKKQLQEWSHIVVGFNWPDQTLGRVVPVKGIIEGVERNQGVPYAVLPYLEYDEANMTKLWSVPKDIPEKPTLEELQKVLNRAFEDMHSVDMQAELGLIAEGICVDETVRINLSSFVLQSIVLNEKVTAA